MTRVYFVVAGLLIAAALLASLVFYPIMPETIPTHWNLQGQVDREGSKFPFLFLMPLVMIAVVALFHFLQWLSPRHFEVETFRATYLYLMVLTVGLLGAIHGFMIYSAWSGQAPSVRLPIGGIFLFIALLGNVLGRVRRNFWIGVRTPWTLASERVWNDTHRLSARLFVAAGLLGFVGVLSGVPPAGAFAFLMLVVLVPVVYSLVHYKRLARRGEV